jgi:hypothetical protein
MRKKGTALCAVPFTLQRNAGEETEKFQMFSTEIQMAAEFR